MFTTTVRAVEHPRASAACCSTCSSPCRACRCSPRVFVLALVALYGMGMMFASMFLLLGREGWHLVNLAQEPVFLLSGTFFPIRSFNFWVAAGASIIPLTLALDAIRQLSFASGAELGFLDVRTEVAVLAGPQRRVSRSPRGCCCSTRAAGDRGRAADGEHGRS